MLTCKFSGLVDNAEIQALTLRVRGGRMYLDDEPTPLAVHTESYWEFAGHHFSRFDVDGPLAVTLVDTGDTASRSFTEARIWFADGVLQSPNGHIVCLNSGSDTWLDVLSGLRYREILLTTLEME